MSDPRDLLSRTELQHLVKDPASRYIIDNLAGYAAPRAATEPPGGTLVDCPLRGGHEHTFLGPHYFREWDPADHPRAGDKAEAPPTTFVFPKCVECGNDIMHAAGCSRA